MVCQNTNSPPGFIRKVCESSDASLHHLEQCSPCPSGTLQTRLWKCCEISHWPTACAQPAGVGGGPRAHFSLPGLRCKFSGSGLGTLFVLALGPRSCLRLLHYWPYLCVPSTYLLHEKFHLPIFTDNTKGGGGQAGLLPFHLGTHVIYQAWLNSYLFMGLQISK